MTGGEVVGEHVDYDEAELWVDDLVTRAWDATRELEAVNVGELGRVAPALATLADRLRRLAELSGGP